MDYTIRDLIPISTWPKMPDLPSKGAAQKMLIKSQCRYGSLVIDGGRSYSFNTGTSAILETDQKYVLKTIKLFSDKWYWFFNSILEHVNSLFRENLLSTEHSFRVDRFLWPCIFTKLLCNLFTGNRNLWLSVMNNLFYRSILLFSFLFSLYLHVLLNL